MNENSLVFHECKKAEQQYRIVKINYPHFIPQYGNLTKLIQNQYLEKYNKINKNENVLSLIASNNKKEIIYFWQLYSIVGRQPIEDLIRRFYTSIFNDNKAPWFRDEFIQAGDIEYHVRGQTNFWIDIMGGGPIYHGGELKVKFKHKMVKNIMTHQGAGRWMFHMLKALNDESIFLIEDGRILPCIINFLYFFMEKYSVEFDFNMFGSKSKL